MSKPIDGIRLNKPKTSYYYRPKVKPPIDTRNEASSSQQVSSSNKDPTSQQVKLVQLRNSFDVLGNSDNVFDQPMEDTMAGNKDCGVNLNGSQASDSEDAGDALKNSDNGFDQVGGNGSESDEVENVYDETANYMAPNPKGASTPVMDVFNV